MDQKTMYNKESGYIALISSIVISVILTGLVFTVARAGFYSRFDSLNAEYKRISKGMAESCVNAALLKVAQDPNYSTNSGNGSPVNCEYTIDASALYDLTTHQKITKITATAWYPKKENGAYSKMEINSAVYDPQYAPPSKVVVKTYSYGVGAKAPEAFGPFKVGTKEVQLGQVNPFNHGTYTITEVSDSAYSVDYFGDCAPAGTLTLEVNDYKACSIVNTIKPQTAGLTIIIVSSDGTMPDLSFNNGTPQINPPATQKIVVASSDGITDFDKQFPITVGSFDASQYIVSNWSGTDCSGTYDAGHVTLKKGENKVCAIAFNKKTGSIKAALTVVTRVVNNYGGTAQPDDFQANITASNSVLHNDDNNGTKTYYIDPNDFEVTQAATTFINYKTPQYLDASYPNLCKCKASDGCTVAAGQSYLCMITNQDIPTKFSLTASVNVTQAYKATSVPDYLITLVDSTGHSYYSGKSGTISDLPPGTYTVSIANTGNYSISSWGSYPDCISAGVKKGTVKWSLLDSNIHKNCSINIVENPSPFHNIDTVLMLDRTGSMFNNSNWIGGERTAAKSFLNLYSEIAVPRPQVGVGVFANDSDKLAMVGTTGYLTSTYGTEMLAPAVTTAKLAGKSGVNSGRNGKNEWTTPDNGRDMDIDYATDVTNGHQQDYSNYSFNVPSGSVITGIEVNADAKTTATPIITPATATPNGIGNFDAWNLGSGANKYAAVASNDNDASYIDESNSQTFTFQNAGVPVGATINSVTLSAVAKSTGSGTATMKLIAENGGTPVTDGGRNLTAGYLTYNWQMTTNPVTTGAWTVGDNGANDVNNWKVKFGVQKTNINIDSPNVTQMYLTVNYSIVTASGVKNGTAFANVNNSGVNWSVVANAQGSDNNYATSALTSSNRTSNYLQATGFGTAIVPTGATIAGIEVKLERAASVGSTLRDELAQLIKNGNRVGNDNAMDTNYNMVTSDTVVTYGGPNDLWGTSWTVADINSGNFGFAYIAKHSNNGSNSTAKVDQITINVYYKMAAAQATLAVASIGSYNHWFASNGNAVSAVAGNDGDASYIGQSSSAQTFAVSNLNVPIGVTINSVTLHAVAKQVNGNGSIQLMAENGNEQLYDVTRTLSNDYTDYAWTMPTNPSKGAWTREEVNNWSTKFGVYKNTVDGTVRITNIYVVVGYGVTPENIGQIAISLSSNDGQNWTAEKTVDLNGTEAIISPSGNGLTDMWGRTWTSSDFGNSFALRVKNNSPNGITTLLNYVTVKINYSSLTATGLYAEINGKLANSHGGTDISAAISTGNTELNRTTIIGGNTGHIIGNKKYLILVSDGKPTIGGSGSITNSEAALRTADTAKTSKGASNDYVTEIYTIHFGDATGRTLLANLATGNTVVTNHQNGSNNDTGTLSDQATIDAENNDGDNFFIVLATSDPTAEMTKIFNQIGQQIINAETPPSATTGSLTVITNVINKNGHTKAAGDFTATLNGSTQISGVEKPGTTITLVPGSYSLAETTNSDYILSVDPSCQGTINIAAGQTITCTLIYDDSAPAASPPPPLPPPPPPNISLTQTLVVVTQVNNDSGTASKTAEDFNFNINNPSSANYQGSDTGVSLDNLLAQAYIVNAPNDPSYSLAKSSDCNSTIASGETKTCVIVYTANPPPPPPIEMQQNIDINSWTEK